MKRLKINLSLSGGGIKGIGHLGAIKALEERGIEISGIAGSSAGAIMAALYGAGYNIDELQEIIYKKDFRDFRDGFSIFRLIRRFGLYKGNSVLRWMKERLSEKGVVTFNDLKRDTKVIVSDVFYKKSEIFSKETTPSCSVAEAVRMSISIPIFYIPYLYQKGMYIDGGWTNNLPLQVFSQSSLPLLGLILIANEPSQESKVRNLINYLGNLIEMAIAVNEQRQIELTDSNIISIPTGDISAIDFSLSKEEKDRLYNWGYNATIDQLDRFIDRRSPEFRRGITDMRGSTVEIEEFSKKMASYVAAKVDIDKFDLIVAPDSDDYLFAYLVARILKKRFAVIKVSDRSTSCHYNRIEEEDRIIILNFLMVDKKKLVSLIDVLKNKGVKIQAGFSFFSNQSKGDIIKLLGGYLPLYSYH